MPVLFFVERYPHPPAVVFDFFRKPANVLAVSPDSLDIRLVEGPERVSSGDRFAVQVRRFGVSRRVETVILQLLEPFLLVERQVEGPLSQWQLERRFVECESGTELTETITFEPPSGLLGMMLSASVLERELKLAYAGRAERVKRLLAGA